MRARVLIGAALWIGSSIAVVAYAADKDPSTRTPKPRQGMTSPAAATDLDHGDAAKWTPTTLEAAASEANKKMLATGKKVTVTGEIVDMSCYLQMGKRGDAHVACGTKCITNGQPIGLVDARGNLYMLMAEEHHPRRDGQLDLKTVFLPLLAKNVTVTGMMTELHGYRALFVPATALGAKVETAKPQ